MSENGQAATKTSDLAARVATLRVRDRGMSVERWLMLIGAFAIGVGLPIILLGWWGASRTPYVFEQIPYLISGGILGLALAVLGGLAYFAYWMTRQVQETRRQSDRIARALASLEAAITAGGLGGGAGSTSNGSFVATEKGTMFHRRDCSVVAGRADVHDVGRGEGLEPCKMCDPLAIKV